MIVLFSLVVSTCTSTVALEIFGAVLILVNDG